MQTSQQTSVSEQRPAGTKQINKLILSQLVEWRTRSQHTADRKTITSGQAGLTLQVSADMGTGHRKIEEDCRELHRTAFSLVCPSQHEWWIEDTVLITTANLSKEGVTRWWVGKLWGEDNTCVQSKEATLSIFKLERGGRPGQRESSDSPPQDASGKP